MTTLAERRPQDDFKHGLVISVVAHVAFVAFFILRAIVFTHDDFENLSALRVDIVALPDKVQPTQAPAPSPEPEAKTPKAEPAKPEAKAPPPPPAPKAKPLPAKTDPDTINLNKTKSKESDALERIKRMQALDKIKDDVAQSDKKRLQAEAAAARAKAGAIKIKGNQLSPGSDLTGLDRLQHEEYRAALDHHIKPFWQLPEWLARKKLKAQALIRIDGQGRLLHKQILKSSGNGDFDDSVLETIDRATPLPAPPEKFISMVSSDGILIEFGSDETQ